MVIIAAQRAPHHIGGKLGTGSSISFFVALFSTRIQLGFTDTRFLALF